jgi:BirA family biotin operon repressor/biotin-[acetyl-CoA-carboxylase] ligase
LYNNLPKTQIIGRNLIYLPTCHSTNDIAASFIGDPDIPEGTIFITGNQTEGKGQRGNKWETEPDKNLTFSFILKPDFLKVSRQFNLNIAISLAVYDLLTIYLPEKVKIKWPNDIFYSSYSGIDKKLGGILIQNNIKKDSIQASVAGIGLNVNQISFNYPQAISMSHLTGKTYDLGELFYSLAEKLDQRYLMLKNNREEQLVQEYLRNMYRFKEEASFRTEKRSFKGKITGIDEYGRLQILSEEGLYSYNFKEIEFLNRIGD